MVERSFKKLSEEAKLPIDAELEQKESKDLEEGKEKEEELVLVRFRDGM